MDLGTLVADLFEQYRAFNDVHPIIGGMATAQVIFPLADIASQLIGDRKISWKKVAYTSTLAPLYGAYSYISVQSGEAVGKIIDDPLAKAAFGPNLIGHAFNLLFFVNNAVGEQGGYRVCDLYHHYRSLFLPYPSEKEMSWTRRMQEKIFSYVSWKEYRKTVLGTLTFWNAFQYVNYSYIPEELRTPSTIAVSFCWTLFLTLWSGMSSKKVMLEKS